MGEKSQTFGRMLPDRSEFKLIYLSQLTKRADFWALLLGFKVILEF